MDAIAFAKVLAQARPSSAVLSSLGIGGEGAASFQAAFELPRRIKRHDYGLPDATLNELYSDFDPSRVEVGPVRFEPAPRQVHDGWIVGDVSGDYLVLQALDGELNVRDIHQPSHLMERCAASGAMFLDGLSLAVEYFAGRLVDRISDEAAGAYAAECGRLSGGQQYQDFYEMLLGVE